MRKNFKISLSVCGLTLAALGGCKVQLPEYEGTPSDAGVGNGAGAQGSSSTAGTGIRITIPVGSQAQGTASADPSSGGANTHESPGPAMTDTADSGTPLVGSSPSGSAAPSVASSAASTSSAMPSASATGTTSTPPGKDVHGRIIDFRRRPLPNIEVTIGNANATTNSNGEFTIANVADTYDVDFVVAKDGIDTDTYGWRYIGLTRRDPTLQSAQTSLTGRSCGIVITTDLPTSSTQNIAVSFGYTAGAHRYNLSYNGIDTSFDWAGGSSLAAKGHALAMNKTDELPTAFTAYTERDISFSNGADLDWPLVINAGSTVSTGTIAGSVTVDTDVYRTDSAYVLFTSNATLPLFEGVTTTSTNFSYLVPTLPNSSVVMLARNSDYDNDTEAYAYKRGLAAGQSGVALSIPNAAKLKTPQPAETANASTSFSWTTDATVSVLHVEDKDFYQGRYVVTSKKALKLSEITSRALNPSATYKWEIQTHGACKTVDECAGPEGSLDPMYYSDGGDFGVVSRDGSGTLSTWFAFKVAP